MSRRMFDAIFLTMHVGFIVLLLALSPMIVRDESWWLFAITGTAAASSVYTIITIIRDARRRTS